jgi:hypothetical protein
LTVLLIWVTNIKKLKEIKHKDILDTNWQYCIKDNEWDKVGKQGRFKLKSGIIV